MSGLITLIGQVYNFDVRGDAQAGETLCSVKYPISQTTNPLYRQGTCPLDSLNLAFTPDEIFFVARFKRTSYADSVCHCAGFPTHSPTGE
jgi:hypothetical protein